MPEFTNVMFQINGGPWMSIFATEACNHLPELDIYDLVKAGVTFGALDHYDDQGKYRNIKFRVEEVS